MFKSTPFENEIRKNDLKMIKAIEIKNLTFIQPISILDDFNSNKINLKSLRPHQSYNSRTQNIFKRVRYQNQGQDVKIKRLRSKDKQKIKQRFLNQFNPFQKAVLKEKSQTRFKNELLLLESNHINRSSKLKSEHFRRKQENIYPDMDSNIFYLNKQTIAQSPNQTHNTKYRKKPFLSIDFQNIFQKVDSQVRKQAAQNLFQKTSRMKDKIQILDKMKKYSKTPNSKARTVFDQFNLKYLIAKRKKFDLKNESHIKGSHMPYFQSFIHNDAKKSICSSHKQKMNNSVQIQTTGTQYLTELKVNDQKLKRKNSSIILIDNAGIVHQQNPEGDRKRADYAIDKISAKVVKMAKMLQTQKNDQQTL